MDLVRGGEKKAQERVKRLFRTTSINGIALDIQRREYDFQWGEPNGCNWYGIPDGSSTKWAICPAFIDVNDWMKLQSSTRNVSQAKFERAAKDDTVAWVQRCVKDNKLNNVPEPVLEIERKEYTVGAQEGRSRGLGAKKAEISKMPIWVAARRERK